MAEQLVLDRVTILDRLGGDEEILAVLVDMFLQDADNYCAQIGAALASGDASLLQREAHTIKSLLATFSDEAGAKCAMQLEVRAKQGDLSGADRLVADIQARLRELAAVLEKDRQAGA